MIPSLGLIFLVLGTIFMGLATPSEAGAMGVVGAIALAFSYGTLSWKLLYEGMSTTMRLTAMVVFILIGARVFSLVFQGVGGKEWIEHCSSPCPAVSSGFLIFVNIFIFIVAFFLDFFEIAFIIIPLLAPVAEKLGIDLIWFGVLVCANIQTSFMHPPFGFALFYLRGIAPKSIKTSDIYWGAVPWVFLQVILVVIVIFWPGSVTYWLGRDRRRSLEGPDRNPDAGPAAAARIQIDENEKPRSNAPGPLCLTGASGYVRVRIRIMKLSKPSSATCFQPNESLRNGIRLSCIFLNSAWSSCARRRLPSRPCSRPPSPAAGTAADARPGESALERGRIGVVVFADHPAHASPQATWIMLW